MGLFLGAKTPLQIASVTEWVSEWVSQWSKSFNIAKYLTCASNPITSFTKLVQISILSKTCDIWPNLRLETCDPTRDMWPNSRHRDLWPNSRIISNLETCYPTWDLWPNSRPMTQLEINDNTRDIWPNSRPVKNYPFHPNMLVLLVRK